MSDCEQCLVRYRHVLVFRKQWHTARYMLTRLTPRKHATRRLAAM